MSTRTVARPPEAMHLVEAAHCGDGDWQSWANGLLQASSRLFVSDCVNVTVTHRAATGYRVLAEACRVPQPAITVVAALAASMPEALDPFWRQPNHVSTLVGIHRGALHPELRKFHTLTGSGDALGLVAVVDQYSVSIGAPHPHEIRLAPGDRQLLRQATLHIEAALRLRVQPSAAIAWLDTDGRVVHAEGAGRAPEASEELSAHVRAVERSRTRMQRRTTQAVDAWHTLISGRWALVEREQGNGKRSYAVMEAQRTRRLRALNELETHAVELSARGSTGKMVAYALGVTPGTVSKLLARAALKLGISNRTELVRLASALLGSGPKPGPGAALSQAEKDILALLRLGFSNAAIARERGRSERTVANQVASLLQKLRAPSRRALAATNAP